MKLLCILGPTASGKTALAVELARRLNGEVVSCDSMQVYRGMDIGTAKPTEAERSGVPHHMIDVCDPWESFSVAMFQTMADGCIKDIAARGRLPILAGGTGLYMDALINGREFSAAEQDFTQRHRLEELADSSGIDAVREILRLHDPESYDRLHPNDRKRIIRAAEVYLTTGKTISQHNRETGQLPPKYDTLKLGLTYPDRQILYDRINLRVDLMIKDGLEDEVRRLLPLCSGSTALQAIGYKELSGYIAGEAAFDEAVETIKQETRRYAKRQLTWLRRDGSIHWLDSGLGLTALADTGQRLWQESN